MATVRRVVTVPDQKPARKAAALPPSGVLASDLKELLESLDSIEEAANGFGSLIRAEIESETSDGHRYVAIYSDHEWRISTKTGSES